MILALTVQDRLTKAKGSSICFEFDIRYMGRWIKEYPNCFPKFVREGNYTLYFNPDKYRWEILRGKRIIKFNAQNWV